MEESKYIWPFSLLKRDQHESITGLMNRSIPRLNLPDPPDGYKWKIDTRTEQHQDKWVVKLSASLEQIVEVCDA